MDSSNLSSSETRPTPQQSDSQKNRRVRNLIIVDESGSMASIYHAAISGLNETLSTIRSAQTEHPLQEHFVTLVTFDSNPGLRYNEIYSNTPANDTTDITSSQYRPSGCTPLYDAVGCAINKMCNVAADDDVVLVTIITDGYENSSTEYNGRTIKRLIDEMKAKGWIFTYIGANQDVEAVAATMSIPNTLLFNADSDGTADMFAKDIKARKCLFKNLENESIDELSVNYFKCIEDEDSF